jgi:hypothetical protein
MSLLLQRLQRYVSPALARSRPKNRLQLRIVRVEAAVLARMREWQELIERRYVLMRVVQLKCHSEASIRHTNDEVVTYRSKGDA